MPDQEGNQKSDGVPGTPLHAYGDGRESDANEGSRGITGDEGTGDPGSYHEGGHEEDSQFGDTPPPTGHQDAPGAHTGSGAGVADPDRV